MDTTGSLRQQLGPALAKGNVGAANVACLVHLKRRDVTSPWDLLPNDNYRRLFQALPAAVQSGDVDAAERAMMQAFDVSDFSNVLAREPEFVMSRDVLADYFCASALLHVPDLDAGAHLICCFETLERLVAIADEGQPPSPLRGAWRVPLSAGTVTMPFNVKWNWPSGPRVIPGGKDDPNEDLRLKAAQLYRPRSFIGDLIVLKQQLRSYELGEIAHVSNTLAHETFTRTHRNLERVETRLLTEEESEKEVTLDMQSTTRDELKSEIDKSLTEQTDLSANFDVTATYLGPSVSVTASVGGSASYRRASEERTATSVSHAREVVNRASEKMRQRTLTQREKVETKETEETAGHTINNTTAQHSVGIYRWLERHFDLHLVNYGRRLIYEFVVPEPAAYWSRLMAIRSQRKNGPPPLPPQIYVSEEHQMAIGPTHFSLRSPQGVALERPVSWPQIVYTAGKWGIALEDPPPPSTQAHYALTMPGAEGADPATAGARFQNGFTVSPHVKVAQSQASLAIPDGYRASRGEIAMKGWRYLRKDDQGNYMYVDGEANILMLGQRYRFTTNNESSPAPSGIAEGGVEKPLSGNGGVILDNDRYMEGQVPVILTSNLNSLSCSIKLDCERTKASEEAWIKKMFLLFQAAYRDKLAAYEEDAQRAEMTSESWADNMPSQVAREIERDELKRAVISQLGGDEIQPVLDTLLSEPAATWPQDPAAPDVDLERLGSYERFLGFFEKAFDWGNVAYIFSPYFYGRKANWPGLALADHADAQFKKFLSAGAARIQVPVRRGYETHATYFFNGLGIAPFDQRVPWLASMRPIAEDLAADAREGFELGEGKVSVANNDRRVTGVATRFNAGTDVDRELRIAGKLHIIGEVISPSEVLLTTAFTGPVQSHVFYELGGIVVGPAIPLVLPTTLVAIDMPGLDLPEFPPRYAA
ncbi:MULTISPECIES: hypothetical protein [unclassified Polaromonas]|uniref:hypothetical protein n=1 Tax=unclassified Polaromonas TaxID=2638319 RepID=UPI000F07A182|nr:MULTISPECIES: hypothetical protein [unclassified Polaromonas]AYQ27773.1 hypothetical protein DT070_06910 [Polaromonas sp. SP1]QGJ17371.1 hypothetical protein F7R28_02515 [Polaromonas sp. Pch-P]